MSESQVTGSEVPSENTDNSIVDELINSENTPTSVADKPVEISVTKE